MVESGLGFTNLLYMATLLAGLSAEEDSLLNVVLVEEPEAHLHPQLQDLLIRHLAGVTNDGIQVIATTHSPNLASSAGIERLTVLSRSSLNSPVVARSRNDFGLTAQEAGHLTRFLDVTKASLVFARRVLLVEGTAEQLLIPAIADKLKRPLADSGVSVISVGGLAFGPFAKLFGPDKLPYRCALVSDGDPPPSMEDTEGLDEEDVSLSATAQRLQSSQNENLRVFLSKKTLEWDLVEAGNWELALRSLKHIRPRVAARLEKEHAGASPQVRADAFLTSVERHKGRFAQALVAELATAGAFVVPEYLQSAIDWITESSAEQTPPIEEPETVAVVEEMTVTSEPTGA